jgi:hypothetical protein
MTRRMILFAIVGGVTISSDARTQAAAPVPTLRQLQSPILGDRVRAFYQLDRSPVNWQTPSAARVLLAALKREDSLMVAVIRESNGKLAAGDKYGEEYAEYESQLQDRCIQYCNREQYLSLVLNAIGSLPELRSSDIDLLSNLYTDPKFSVSAAQRARIDHAFVFAASDHTSFLTRASGLGAIGVAIRSGLPSPEDLAQFHRTAVNATSDPYVDVRLGAVHRLTELNDPSDLPLLQRLAAEDTAHSMKAGMVVYPVRDAARAAAAGLRKVP